MHNLSYGDINSEDYKAYITNAGIYKSPKKRYRKYTVPGRNGELLEDTGTFENVEVEYPFCVYENCDTNYRAYVAAMRRKKGYQRIEDTFHPEYYRMGAFIDEFEPKEVTPDGEMCNGVLKFDCMPQKFLKSGEMPLCLLIPEVFVPGDGSSMNELTSSKIAIADTEGVHIAATNQGVDGLVYVSVYEYNGTTETRTYQRQVRMGETEEVDVVFSSGSEYWRLALSVDPEGNVNTVRALVSGKCYINDELVDYEASFANKHIIHNPTGFRAKPLFEFNSFGTGSLQITNMEEGYTSGVADEYYVLSLSGGTQNDHVYLDCDAQYMYDDEGNNVTNQLSIVTAQSADGRSLVFPEFGSSYVLLMLDAEHRETVSNSPNLVFIYPRWWTT